VKREEAEVTRKNRNIVIYRETAACRPEYTEKKNNVTGWSSLS
jgi:hypothetical protein